MRFTSSTAAALLVLALGVRAAPAPKEALVELDARASITALTAAQIAAFTPYTYYASAGYCKPPTTLAWNCGGGSCDAAVMCSVLTRCIFSELPGESGVQDRRIRW
jgi:hypothetical protein